MRQIKFRAFDPKNGMIEPYSVRHGKAFIIKRCNKNDPTVTVDGVNFYCNWDIDVATDFPVMQFTGLLDANGVEIYEGDIVSVAGHGNCEVKICPYYGVTYSDSDGYAAPHADCAAELDYPTVIGNIYQNSDLLS